MVPRLPLPRQPQCQVANGPPALLSQLKVRMEGGDEKRGRGKKSNLVEEAALRFFEGH